MYVLLTQNPNYGTIPASSYHRGDMSDHCCMGRVASFSDSLLKNGGGESLGMRLGAMWEVIARQLVLYVTFSLLQFYSSDGSSLPKNITLLNTLIPTLSEMVEEVVIVLAHRSHPLTPPTLHPFTPSHISPPSSLTGPLHLSILTHHPSLLHSIIQQNEYWLHQPPCTQLSTHPQWKYLSNKWYTDACLIPRSL